MEAPARYLPEAYAALPTTLYGRLGMTVQPLAAKGGSFARHTVTEVEIMYFFRHAVITIEQHGADLIENVKATMKSLEDEDIRTIYIDLPLDDPLTPRAVPALQACGFVFCGLMPLFHHERDYLRLQRLSEPLNLDQLVLYSDTAHTIRKQIEQELPWMSSKQVNAWSS
jgi:hypothetical protein